MKDKRTGRVALLCRAWLLLGGILGPVVAAAGIPTVWNNVTMVKLGMGETKTYSDVDQRKLFCVVIPGTIAKEQDKIYFQIVNRSPSGKRAVLKLYAKPGMDVPGSVSQIGIDTTSDLVQQWTDIYGAEYLLPENPLLWDVAYYLNVSDVSCTVTFSRPMKTFEVTYSPGAHANETSSEKSWTFLGLSLKLKGAIFTRAGYEQTGWATTDGGPQAYAFGESYAKNVSVTLYPVWTPIPATPTKPTLRVTSGSGQSYIGVSWTGGNGAMSFDLYRSTSDVRPNEPFATNVTSPYEDGKTPSGLTPGVKYYYWVSAVNAEGTAYSDSGWGSVAVALSLDKLTDSHAANGGSGSVSVSANASWMAMTDAGWIAFGTKSGNGDGTLTYTVAENALDSSRTGTVVVVAGADTGAPVTKTISVTQEGASNQGFAIVDGVLTKYVGAGGVVTIPDGVTSIGTFAFKSCRGLTSVTIPSSVTNVGYGAFSFCDGLATVTILPGVAHIDDFAFSNCGGLTSVTLPPGVLSIGDFAFSNCGGLTAMQLPSSVLSIGECAFADCSGLTSVTVPTGVTSIGASAFSGCSSLPDIVVADDNAAYCSLDGILYDKTMFELIQCPAGKSGAVVIPSDVRKIGEWAFADCAGITSAVIPSSVGIIGQSAFVNCRGLVSLKIPSSVGHVAEAAFSECNGLKTVTIAEGVRSIGDWAFGFCRGLKTVTIPSSVVSIGQDAFDRCLFLTEVHVSNNGDIDAVRRMLSASGFNVDTLTFDHIEEHFEVVFDAKGGAGTMPSLQMSPGCVYLLTPCTFTPPSGKRFAGWRCSNGRRYDDGMLVFDLAKPGETVTMTAIWE